MRGRASSARSTSSARLPILVALFGSPSPLRWTAAVARAAAAARAPRSPVERPGGAPRGRRRARPLALAIALLAGCGAATPGPREPTSSAVAEPPAPATAARGPAIDPPDSTGAVGVATEPSPDEPADAAAPRPQDVETPANHALSAADVDPALWVEPTRLDPTIRLDVRYATAANFMGEAIYPCARCLLRPEVAAAIVVAHRELQGAGFGGLVLFDCYRPSSLQRRLWEKSPDPRAVAPPSRGSMHARGLAVDLSIVDREGREVDMGSPYDHFGPRAYHGARGLAPAAVEGRERLRSAMERAGFRPLRSEWWHYSWSGSRAPAADFQWACPPGP